MLNLIQLMPYRPSPLSLRFLYPTFRKHSSSDCYYCLDCGQKCRVALLREHMRVCPGGPSSARSRSRAQRDVERDPQEM